MQIDFFFKNLRASKRLEAYVRERIEEMLGKYTDKPIRAKLTFGKGSLTQTAKCQIDGGVGSVLQAEYSGDTNIYNCTNRMLEKLGSQLKKRKEKSLGHRGKRVKTMHEEFTPSHLTMSVMPFLGSTVMTEDSYDEYSIDAEDLIKYEAARYSKSKGFGLHA